MNRSLRSALLLAALAFFAALPLAAQDEEWLARRIAGPISEPDPQAGYWRDVPPRAVSLVAQPMVRPRPKETTTSGLLVQAVHDGSSLALRFVWRDEERSEAGRLGEYSDALAVMFPLTPGDSPPPIFMGTRGLPVHIFHWRAQYQRDQERGKPTMRDLYPNLSIDMYPMEYADPGSADPPLAAREQYSPGLALGNPQSFPKSSVDEIWAEGFSTSSVQESAASGHGVFEDGVWTLVVVRPLARAGGSSFAPGGLTYAAFAVWQGGKDEVGARKSVTMTWTPLRFEGAPAAAAASDGGPPGNEPEGAHGGEP
jgi:hypothetical protein